MFQADFWWATAAGWPFVALLAGLLAHGFFTRSAFGLVTAFAGVGLFFVAGFFVFGAQPGLWIASAALLCALIVSLFIHTVPRWFNVARVALVLVAMGAGAFNAQPAQRSTRELLRTAIYVKKFPQKPSWLYPELLARSDARGQLERQLMYEKKGDPNAIELHRELGFPAEVRREACHTLRPEERTKACPGE